jgi:hypothetical protein
MSNYEFTETDILRERVERGLSWKQVAINLGLKTPDQARKAYTALTGRPHNETQITTRKARSTGVTGPAGVNGAPKTLTPRWTNQYISELSDEELDALQSEITDTITGRDITIDRVVRSITIPLETLHVRRVTRFSFEGPNEELVVHLYDKRIDKDGSGKYWEGGHARCIKVSAIVQVS